MNLPWWNKDFFASPHINALEQFYVLNNGTYIAKNFVDAALLYQIYIHLDHLNFRIECIVSIVTNFVYIYFFFQLLCC